jgi:hypothetical protein
VLKSFDLVLITEWMGREDVLTHFNRLLGVKLSELPGKDQAQPGPTDDDAYAAVKDLNRWVVEVIMGMVW